MLRPPRRSTALLLSILLSAGALAATPSVAGADGSATGAALRATRGVPRTSVVATFTDSEPGPIRDEQALVEATFNDLLGRAPDAAGLQYWRGLLQQGMSATVFTGALTGSDEWARRTVGQLYQSYLGRAANSGEAAYWGAVVQSSSLDTVRSALLASDEYYAKKGFSPNGFVAALYVSTLERPADSGGLSYWSQRVASGTARSIVTATFAGLDEAHARRVDHLVADLLDRPANDGDRAFGVAIMRGGAERALIAITVGSAEYFQHLPSAYEATVTWAGGAPVAGIIRRTGANSFSVTSSRAIGSVGTFGVDVTVTKGGAAFSTAHSTIEVLAPRNERWLAGAYPDLFGRPLDISGAVAWTPPLYTGGASTRTAVTSFLLASPEGRGILAAGVYQEYLARAPGGSEAAFWGGVLSGQSLRSVRAAILGSDERFAKSGGTNGGYVDTLFQLVLGRGADDGGRSYLLGLLNGGMSRANVAAILLGSPEAGGYRAAVLYQRLLGRAPSSGEARFWGTAISTGVSEQQVMASILGSLERFDRYPRA